MKFSDLEHPDRCFRLCTLMLGKHLQDCLLNPYLLPNHHHHHHHLISSHLISLEDV